MGHKYRDILVELKKNHTGETAEALEAAIRLMTSPEEYVYIRKWGEMLYSHPAYIRETQERAAREGAPLNAVFRSADAEDADTAWRTTETISSPGARAFLGLPPLEDK